LDIDEDFTTFVQYFQLVREGWCGSCRLYC